MNKRREGSGQLLYSVNDLRARFREMRGDEDTVSVNEVSGSTNPIPVSLERAGKGPHLMMLSSFPDCGGSTAAYCGDVFAVGPPQSTAVNNGELPPRWTAVRRGRPTAVGPGEHGGTRWDAVGAVVKRSPRWGAVGKEYRDGNRGEQQPYC